MNLSLRPRHLVAGALFWVVVMSLMTPHMAGARTMLQIGDGMTLSFSDGDIDVRSGSGELHGVEISENGEVALTADYLNIDAEGTLGDDDWYINSLLMKNALVPDAGLFINRVEMRDLFAGALDGTLVADSQAVVTEQSLIRMTNLSLEAEEALISIDEISSLPIRLSEPTPGNIVVTEGGLAVKGMTIMPLAQARGRNPLIDNLAERGLNSVALDFIVMTKIDFLETGMHVGYEFAADIHDLANIEFAVRFAVDDDVYALLLPLLAEPEDNAMAMLGLSGAIAIESGRLVIDDSGLGDIAFAAAAEEEGVSEAEYRSMLRMSAAAGVGATFPENVARLLPPVEAMLKQGGRLSVIAAPAMPVPLTSFVGFAMYPDLAINQLRIALTHQP
jgi:hypothetical protein